MTVSSTNRRSGPYSGNGVTTSFAYGFRILDALHVRVVRTIAGEDATVDPLEYTVSGVGDQVGGSITFSVAPPTGQSITIIRAAPFTQQVDLENQGAYYAETIEEAFDLATMRDQQMQEELDRSLKIAVGVESAELDNLVIAVRTVSGNVADINTVAGISGDVSTAAGVAADISTVADNVVDVTWLSDVYYGPAASDPATRRDGSALVSGDFYFNTTTDLVRVWDGAAWLSSVKAAGVSTYRYVATAAQTVFTGADAAGAVLYADAGSLLVTLNGVALIEGVDYTVTDGGDSVTLTAGATLDDDLVILSFDQIDFTGTLLEMQAIADRIDLGALDAAVEQTGLDAAATAADRVQTGLDAAATAADRVQTGLDAAATAADVVTAEAARDAAFVGADVYADIATGRAAVADGEQFIVVSGTQMIRYRRDSSTTQTEVARYYSVTGVDDPQREHWGVFFVDPYYEKVGNDLYVKPSPYLATSNVAYIRGGFLSDTAWTYEQIKTQLGAITAPSGCEIGATSPSGVADCIKLFGASTIWVDVATLTWGWSARTAKQAGKVKVLENNFDMVGQSSEQPEALYKLALNELPKTRTEPLCPIITPNSSVGFPNVDLTANTLTIFADTIFMLSGVPYLISTTQVIDLNAVASTAKLVWIDTRDRSFTVTDFNDGLTEVQKSFYLLVAVIRHSPGSYSHVAMSCKYTVNGASPYAGLDVSYFDWAAIFTPLTGVTASENLPNYDTATNTLTFYADTIFSHGNAEWVTSADTSVTMAASSANKVFWDKTANALVARAWNSNLNSAEQARFVQVAAIRDPDAGNPSVTSTISMLCPYTVNGRLLGYIDLDEAADENRVGAAVEGIHHRGFSGPAPENTLAAYKASAVVKNYPVEGDIQWTSDDVPVLLHDSTIDRTSDGTGLIASMTLATAKTYDYGSWKSADFAGEQIPTFEEFLALCKKLDLYAHMEIKASGTTVARVQQLLALIKSAGMKGRVDLYSFVLADLQKVVAEDPTQNVGFLGTMSSGLIANAATLLTGTNRVWAAVSAASITPALMAEARTAGLDVVCWTVNNAADVPALAALGVDGIMTDTLNIAQVLRDSVLA